ncbi:MAG: hypothetical protein KAG61_07375 [Bacteriovoracaceae bacterium]|nr:hypothetical protein [Bacteriovoracaceae bacterium]
MKKTLLAVMLIVFCAGSFASKSVKEGILVYDPDKIMLKKFQAHHDLTIDHVQFNGYEVYGPEGLKRYASGITDSFISIDTSRGGRFSNSVNASYPTNRDDEKTYLELAAKYPNIIKLESIGKSGSGEDLWVIKISDNAQVDEKEPEFAYVANMHGNEVVGRRLLVRLLSEMVVKYTAGDPEMIRLIDNNEIFFMPSLNPDGHAKRRRGNAKWLDLNRDFPDFASNANSTNSVQGRAIETIAMMNFHARRHIALSGSFHDGAVVVNYPWDTTKVRPPLHQMIRDISLEYAGLNSNMRDSYNWKNGVTNGYDWYELNGGMQDWAYYYHGDLMITLELSNNKWPHFREIDHQYDLNRDSMMAFMKRIDQGAGFISKDPSDQGWVEITSLATGKLIGNYPYFAGEYYKILPVGDYSFKINSKQAEGTKSVEISVNRNIPMPNGNLIHL